MMQVDLFTMCGGFSYNITCEDVKRLKDESTATTREVIRQLAKEPLLFDPGTHFDYSLCHDILGAVIEAVSGKTLDRYLKDEIFLPLSIFHLSPIYESGGAGLYSTTSDYAKLADAIACGGTAYNGYEVLKPETVAMYYSQEVIGGPKCSYEEHQHNVMINMIYQILNLGGKI